MLLRVRYDGDVLRVEVHDSGTGVPRIPGDPDEGGRDPGKLVWAEFAVQGPCAIPVEASIFRRTHRVPTET